jgi:hypothetical protein
MYQRGTANGKRKGTAMFSITWNIIGTEETGNAGEVFKIAVRGFQSIAEATQVIRDHAGKVGEDDYLYHSASIVRTCYVPAEYTLVN